MNKKYIITLLGTLSLTLSACVSSILKPEADPTEFYVLKASATSTKSEANTEELAKQSRTKVGINVSPITLPSYLDKLQIVSLEGKNKLRLDEFNRWSESLSGALTRVMYLNLKTVFAADSKIYSYPMFAFDNSLPTLTLSIFELAGTLNGESKIKAVWTLGDAKADKLLLESSFEKSVSNGKGYEAYVDSLSKLLADLSVDIESKISDYYWTNAQK